VPDLIGSVDGRRRPLVRVPVTARDDLLAIVDTAFTGELLLDEEIARSWAVLMLDVRANVELGDGTRREVKQGLLTVTWLGVDRDVTVQVVPRALSPRFRQDGDPFALVGTELLNDQILLVDFPAGTVNIRLAE
jgi:predicted aspartyl protease